MDRAIENKKKNSKMAKTNNSSNKGFPKHSGAKEVHGANGGKYISGWNYSSRSGQMMSFIAAPVKKDNIHVSKKGITYLKFVAKITSSTGVSTVSCWYDKAQRKLRFATGWVASLNASRGGYWGPISKRK